MGLSLFIAFFITLVVGSPIWVVLSGSSLAALQFSETTIPLTLVVQRMFTAADSFPLLAIPLFMVAGNLMEHGGISRRLINFTNALLGGFTGGLAMVTVASCMFFAAISGSGPATVAAIGGIMYPYMVKAGYDKAWSAAIIAVAGAIGVIIPPSIPLVNYGIVGNVSISTLFAAGFLPGILLGVALMVLCYLTAKKFGYGIEARGKFSKRRVLKTFLEAFWALLMPIIVLGGIYGGIFTPTEAAGVSVIYGFVVGVFIYRELKLKDLMRILLNAVRSTAMVMMIIAAAAGFGWILTAEKIPDAIALAITSFTSSKFLLLLIINVLLLIIGCLMETTAAIYIMTPILLPIATMIGIHPVHFGIIMVMNLAIGFSTPPLGVNLFVACGLGNLTIEKVSRRLVLPLLVSIAVLFLITYIGEISLLVPRLMGLVR